MLACQRAEFNNKYAMDSRNELAALRKSHADAVEAAVREIEDLKRPHSLRCIDVIRKHLGPAQGEKGN